MVHKRRYSPRYILVAVWLLFTLSLSAWWISFGFKQIDRLMQAGYAHTDDLVRYQRMLILEGSALFLAIFGGGATLVYYMYRELRHGEQVRDFFMAFSHEIKTALSAVQLQAEMLQERSANPEARQRGDKFLADVEKLGLQLNNSLLMANLGERDLHLEDIRLADVIESLRYRFPQIQISCEEDAQLKVDLRAVESIIANLVHNAVVHGGATQIVIRVQEAEVDRVDIVISNNGRGLQGTQSRLGEKFYRHYSGSGSGLGLYLVKELVVSMGGAVAFLGSESGFSVNLKLSGKRL